ncbi:hypothetical protein SDC9_56155 [bioreactor metagenome]|uniref:Copper amine oxidase-like N-terminal domain-containing protein n=1 Tax=bioreactor metagenome TaxID=1076179 RepID=A0A644X126_9ZZZZ
MKNKLPPFLAGVFTTALICSLTVTALAASGQVSFNLSAIKFNGQQISAKGENYTLSSGTNVPASITYTDENGGGTTYLPAKRISELVGVEIGYDAATGSVTIGQKATSSTQTSEASSDKANIKTAQDAVDELKSTLKNPGSLILNKVRLFYYEDQTNFYHVEIDYSATNSLGGYDRSNFYYPMLYDTTGGTLKRETASIIDRDGYDYISVASEDLEY